MPNPNTGVVDLLTNGVNYNYNALQVDVRRRFSQGLALKANYTFSKNLTDAQGTGQTRFEPLLDITRPESGISRADYDQTHKFNLLTSYELPFGKGRPFLNEGIAATIFGNFQYRRYLPNWFGRTDHHYRCSRNIKPCGTFGKTNAVTSLTNRRIEKISRCV